MYIEHVAVWVRDLEAMRAFYAEHFGARAGAAYHNPRTGLRTYFLRFEGGARLELMQRPDVLPRADGLPREGWAHLAFALKDRAAVDARTRLLCRCGCALESGPRLTGDGYYESCVLDPEGNRIELTAEG